VVGGKAITKHRKLIVSLRLGARRDRVAIVCGIVIFVATLAASAITGLRAFSIWSVATNIVLVIVGLFAVGAPYLLYRLVKERPHSPFAFMGSDKSIQRYLRRLDNALPFLFMLSLFLPAFSLAKSHVGYFFPYVWDQTFLELDRTIHGTDAWRLLQPLIGYPVVTFVIGMAYQVWILLLYMAVPCLWVMSVPKSLLRQFGLSYVLCWTIIGGLFANIFASVGPCFLEPMLGNDHFSPLMDYLRDSDRRFPVLALDVQQRLLEWRAEDDGNLGRGISAMPSMHVSIALLAFLGMRRTGRIAGWVFGAFFVVIVLGSVHTGYHYAVDSYAAIILTLLIWWAVGRFFSRERPVRLSEIHYQPMPTS
jgi:PAP2 superfamily